MTTFEMMELLQKEKDGMLQLTDALNQGISKPMFYEYVRERQLEKVAPGIYISEDAWVDTMYLLHLRFKQAVFSHETALFLLDLADREPMQYTLTVKTGYNPSRMKEEGLQIFTVKEDLMGLGVTTRNTLCRFMIWNAPSVTCFAAAARLKFRPCRRHSNNMQFARIKTFGH